MVLLVVIAFVLAYAAASTVVLSEAPQEATQVPGETATTSGDDEVELSRRIDELSRRTDELSRRTDEQQREQFDYRESQIGLWMGANNNVIALLTLVSTALALVFTALSLVFTALGFFGYREFRKCRRTQQQKQETRQRILVPLS